MSAKGRLHPNSMPVSWKINIALTAVFGLVLIANITHSVINERRLVEHVVNRQANDLVESYFDATNTLMLTGGMQQRALLRKKYTERPEVLDARILRGELVSKQFGPGLPEEQPTNARERAALEGQAVDELTTEDGARVLTILTPIRAQKDVKGTNCLLCHPVPENSVLGAIVMRYSLKELDAQVLRNLLTSSAIQVAMFAIGLILIGWLLKRFVTARIGIMRDTIDTIERSANLVKRIPVTSEDEIGATSSTFNRMLERFRTIILQAARTSDQLVSTAGQVSEVADKTHRGVKEQRTETDQLATAIAEMAATSQEVARNAAETATTTDHANHEAKKGMTLSHEAIAGIEGLATKIQRAGQVIQTLENESNNISMVLDVIRDIADQTNLLALNAAIEAARAGDSGRGFAVVADEVRNLAQRTQDSTSEIAGIIGRLKDEAHNAVGAMHSANSEVDATVTKVHATVSSLELIASKIESIYSMNDQIATAVEQQSAVAEELNRNICTISQVADDAAHGAEATTAASREMDGLARELHQAVSQFTVED